MPTWLRRFLDSLQGKQRQTYPFPSAVARGAAVRQLQFREPSIFLPPPGASLSAAAPTNVATHGSFNTGPSPAPSSQVAGAPVGGPSYAAQPSTATEAVPSFTGGVGDVGPGGSITPP